MLDDVRRQWERLLNPDELKPYLLFCSIFITSYEILKASFIDNLVSFFSDYGEQKGFIKKSSFEEKVLSLIDRPNRLQACIKWHQQHGVIDDNDIQTFKRITDFRNVIAHELLKHYEESSTGDIGLIFNEMVDLIDKVEKWWIINFELAIDPPEGASEIDYERIVPGAIMTVRVLVDIALGDKEESEFYYKEFIKTHKRDK